MYVFKVEGVEVALYRGEGAARRELGRARAEAARPARPGPPDDPGAPGWPGFPSAAAARAYAESQAAAFTRYGYPARVE